MNPKLVADLAHVLNVHCLDNETNTPDFILAEYLVDCIVAYNAIKVRNDEWHGAPNRTLAGNLAQLPVPKPPEGKEI